MWVLLRLIQLSSNKQAAIISSRLPIVNCYFALPVTEDWWHAILHVYQFNFNEVSDHVKELEGKHQVFFFFFENFLYFTRDKIHQTSPIINFTDYRTPRKKCKSYLRQFQIHLPQTSKHLKSKIILQNQYRRTTLRLISPKSLSSSRNSQQNHKNPSVSVKIYTETSYFLPLLLPTFFPFLRRPQAQFPVGRDT